MKEKQTVAGRKTPDCSKAGAAKGFIENGTAGNPEGMLKMEEPKTGRYAKATTFHLDQELLKRLKIRAAHEDTRPVHVLERALREYLGEE